MTNTSIALCVSNVLLTIMLAQVYGKKWKYHYALEDMCKRSRQVIGDVFDGNTRITAMSEVHMQYLEESHNRAMVVLGKREA